MTQLRWQTHLGFAKETGGWGVSIAAPVNWVPVEGGAKFKDDLKFYYDEDFRSVQAKDFGAYATVATGNFEFKTDLFTDTFPLLCGVGIVGDNDVVTTVNLSVLNLQWTAGTTNAHTFIIQPKQPASFTLFDYDGYSERNYQGSRIEEVGIKYSPDGRLEIDYKGKSRLSVVDATSGVSTAVIGPLAPVLAWQGLLTLNGAVNTRLIETQLTLKRATEVLFTQANTQSPTNIYCFPLEVDGKITVDFADETEYNLYRNNVQTGTFDLLFVSASNSAVRFTIPHPVYTSYEVDRGKDYLTAVLDFKGIYSQTSSTNVTIVVYNNTATPY